MELRLKPVRGATAVRITYNTLLAPERTATTLALGGSAQSPKRAWPHGARVVSPADVFVTVHGGKAEVVRADGTRTSARVPVTVDRKRFQVELRIPHSVVNPVRSTGFRVAAATGVWDPAAGAYVAPDDGAALYNVAFRYDETVHPRGIPIATWFRDSGQRAALTEGDLTPYSTSIDFTKLARGVNDDMRDKKDGVPVHGSISRINVTHYSSAPGRGTTTDSSVPCTGSCTPEFSGKLQQYFLHVPVRKPAGGYRLAIYNHGCGNNQNELFGSRVAREISAMDGGTILLAANGRARCLWYLGISGASIFEAWADAAAHYPLDSRTATVTGYSMGGFGTLMLASAYPDIFSRAMAMHPCTQTGVAGSAPASETLPLVRSLRHVPLALWHSANDPVCQYQFVRDIRDDLDARGYAHDMFTLMNDHFTDMTHDVLTPAIDWLRGLRPVERPGHVSYVLRPALAVRSAGMTPGDRVYWLSGLRTRGAGDGSVEASSAALGEGRASALPLVASGGVLPGGDLLAPLPYTSELRDVAAPPAAPVADRLRLTLRNLGAVSVDVRRAGLTCKAKLEVDTDGPVAVRLAGCGTVRRFG